MINMQLKSKYDFNKKYIVQQKVGEGAFGKVFRIRELCSNQVYALKKIHLRANEDFAQYIGQIQIQMFLAHPLVLKIFEFYIHDKDPQVYFNRPQVGIIMELGKRSLCDIIKDQSQEFPIQQIINFSYSFVKLFAFFQDQNIVHRDIKPQNFIQFQKGLQCKLIDFGLCTHVKDIRTVSGSFHYLSPKLKKLYYSHKSKQPNTNPFKDDVYSFGLTLYQLITRKCGNRSLDRISFDIYRWTKSQQLADIVQIMLEHEQQRRPDFRQLHDIFNEKFTFLNQMQELQQPVIEQIHQDIQIDNYQLRNSNISSRSTISKMSIQNQKMEIFSNSPAKDQNFNFFNNCQFDQRFQKQARTQKIQEIQISQLPHYDNLQTMRQKSGQHQDAQQFKKTLWSVAPHISIMSIIKMKEFIICGCINGSIYVIDTKRQNKQQIYKLRGMNNQHKKYISAMKRDKYGRLWTVSGDGSILLWNKTKFYDNLRNEQKFQQQQIRRANIFGQRDIKKKYYVNMDSSICTPIQLPLNNQSGISTLNCTDEKEFAVGFNDGNVYFIWKNIEMLYHPHTQPVTCIKFWNNKLITSGLDGCIKVFDLTEMSMEDKFFECGHPICQFQISGDNQRLIFNIVTADGKYFVYSVHQAEISSSKQKNQQITDTLTAVFSNKCVYSLTSNGILLRNNQLMQISQGNGWSCLAANEDDGLVMGCFEGKIALIEWKR